jgi:protein tyrosine phosphatase (PTP) superfamily phosphohydrolase (DUF442 family)
MNDIKNFLRISDRLSCSGQPDESQLIKIAEERFEVVINLGLSDGKYALSDEANSVTGLGLAYYHISVQFDNPRLEELSSFMAIMHQHEDKKTLVHCAVNYRASAFSGLYLFAISAINQKELAEFIAQIWNPDPVWQQFIGEASRRISEKSFPMP